MRSNDKGETVVDANTVAVKTPKEDRDHLDDMLVVWAREIPEPRSADRGHRRALAWTEDEVCPRPMKKAVSL